MPRWMSLIPDQSPAAIAIISVALILACGFLMTRITKKLRLPNVTAYIVSGILMGPFCLNLIPGSFVDNTGFLPDIALAFIAFSTGEFFRFSAMKKNGAKVVGITLFESVSAAVLVFIMCRLVLKLDFAFSVVLSALATATAPASTMMTIRQTRAKGDFVETLLQVVALDDIVGLVLYSIAISLASAAISSEGFRVSTILLPMGKTLATVMLGGMLGLLLKLLTGRRRTDNRLILAIAVCSHTAGSAPRLTYPRSWDAWLWERCISTQPGMSGCSGS